MAMKGMALHITRVSYNLLFLLLPLVFFPSTSELFELPKLIIFYGLSIVITTSFLLSFFGKSIKIKLTGLEIPILLFLLALLLSTIFSIEVRTSLLGYYSRWNGGLIPTITLAILFVIYVSIKDKKLIRTNINSILISGALVSLWGIFEKLGVSPSCVILRNEFSVSCWVQDVQNRVFATFGQPNWMAAFLAMIMPFAIYRQIRAKSTKQLIIYSLLQILIISATLFTRSRSGFLSLIVSQLLTTYLLFRTKGQVKIFQRKLALTSFVVFLLTVFTLGSPFNKGLINLDELLVEKSSTSESAGGTVIDRGGTESGAIRLIVWRGAIELFRLNPLLGTGPETFALSYYRARPIEHNNTSEWNYLYNKAHNEFLNYLATTGVVGSATYLALLLVAVLYLFKNKTGIATASLVAIISASVSNFWGFSTVTTSFLLFMAMAIGLKAQKGPALPINKYWPIFGLTIVIIAIYNLQLLFGFTKADLLYASGISNSVDNPQKAVDDLKEASAAFPNEPLYIDELANAKLNLLIEKGETTQPDKLAEIDELLERSVKLAPNNVKLIKSAIYTYDTMGEIDPQYLLSALKLSSRITLLAPSDPTIYYQIGLTAAKIGDEKSSEDALAEAIVLKPDYKKARQLLAVIYEGQERTKEAIAQLDFVLKNISPEDTYIASEIARLTKKGQ